MGFSFGPSFGGLHKHRCETLAGRGFGGKLLSNPEPTPRNLSSEALANRTTEADKRTAAPSPRNFKHVVFGVSAGTPD